MLWIAGSLLGAWILSWFGFDHVMQTGMKEVFEVYISKTGYYFIFGFAGLIKSVLWTLRMKPIEVKGKQN